MGILKFALGWLHWHVRAGFWYVGLVFRLYFAIGLDSGDDHPGRTDARAAFRCPYARTYRRHLKRS